MWPLHPIARSIVVFAVLCAAHPFQLEASLNSLVRRVESPDNSCGMVDGGNNLGYTCGASNTGPCCSQHGWCGSSTDYCSTGCQPAFGTCDGGQTAPADPNDDGTCGPANNNKVCSGGKCCSPSGFCGTTTAFCMSPDCQRNYGSCDADITPPGASTAGVARSLLGKVPFGADILDCEQPGTIALTYDDGPYTYTPDLLDVLASYNAKATFFVTGNNLGKGRIDDPALPWAAMVQRMITDGHQVASHSWSHADLSLLNETLRRDEMVKNEMAIRNILGKWPTYMRPPYSSCNAACLATMKDLGYHVTYFDLDTQDYTYATPATNQIAKDIIHNALVSTNPLVDNRLSIMHDIHEQTVHNLTEFFLKELTLLGFRAVPVGECLNDSPENWYRTMDGEPEKTTPVIAPDTTSTTSTTSTITTPEAISTTTFTISTTSTTISTTSTTISTTSTTMSTPIPTSTTTIPTPTPTGCTTFKVADWCAKPILRFTNKTECNAAYTACAADKCWNGLRDILQCLKYTTDWCLSLQKFCRRCTAGRECTNAAWGKQ